MTTKQPNGGRPLPWHDSATCDDDQCRGPMMPISLMDNGYSGPPGTRIACAGCGKGRVGTPGDLQRTVRAAKAWEMFEAGLVHPDRGCARCNGALTLDRFRLCSTCVAKDNDERQGVLL